MTVHRFPKAEQGGDPKGAAAACRLAIDSGHAEATQAPTAGLEALDNRN